MPFQPSAGPDLQSGAASRTLVLGIGNVLLGDEGVGVHAAQQLEQEELPPDVSVIDGGTGGFQLLSCFREYDRIVMIDASMDGRPCGTVSTIRPRFASEFPRSLSAHDIGLRDLIESASLLAPLPEMVLITVSVAETQPLSTKLSTVVSASLPQVLSQVRASLGVDEPSRGNVS